MSEVVFDGFPRSGIAFLRELSENNNRAWFEENRARYKNELEAPAKHFRAAIEAALSSRLGESYSGKIFRLHRDLRFSKDKTPYNTQIRMAFFSGGNPKTSSAFFFSLEPEGFVLGGGAMGFSPGGLDGFRARLLDDETGPAVADLIRGLLQEGFRLEPPELKRVPAGFDKAHPREALLRRKSLTIWRDFDGHTPMTKADAVEFCCSVFAQLHPLLEVLDD